MVQFRDMWLAVVKTVMNITDCKKKKLREFLYQLRSVRFRGRIFLCGVR